jgi:23S rRNA (guanosine2251-2'-O)-methyltransferase
MKKLQLHKISVSALTKEEKKKNSSLVHQGVIAKMDTDKLYVSYNDIVKKMQAKSRATILLLDEVQDPQNVGAIIRSAVAFGVDAILMGEHNQAHVTGAVIKSSVGMVFKIPLCIVGNINQTLRDLKKRDFWVYGMALKRDAHTLPKVAFAEKTIIVVGNEGEGIREKTLEHCDETIFIPIAKECESLNVSVATAVALYHRANS